MSLYFVGVAISVVMACFGVALQMYLTGEMDGDLILVLAFICILWPITLTVVVIITPPALLTGLFRVLIGCFDADERRQYKKLIEKMKRVFSKNEVE